MPGSPMAVTGSGDPVRCTRHARNHHLDFACNFQDRVSDPVGTTISAAVEIVCIAGRKLDHHESSDDRHTPADVSSMSERIVAAGLMSS